MNEKAKFQFTAEDARKATKQVLTDGERVRGFLHQVTQKIKEACQAGRRSITDPFDYGINGISMDEREAVKEQLVAMGYIWKSHPDPDPGHPCSGPYETLSW
jgi:hypothetical protein